MAEQMEWIAFYNKHTGAPLLRISIEGTFEGEIEATTGLLAYENNIQESDIETRLEQ